MENKAELFYKINHEPNFDKAQGMLDMLNLIYGTHYFFVRRRVCFESDGEIHDAWATEDESI